MTISDVPSSYPNSLGSLPDPFRDTYRTPPNVELLSSTVSDVFLDYAEQDIIVRCPYCKEEVGRNIGPDEAIAAYIVHIKASNACVIASLHDE